MTIRVRTADPSRDFARVAELMTAASLDATTEADLQEDEARVVPGKVRLRLVAVDERDDVVGQAWAVHYPSQRADLFHVGLSVDAAHRGRGVGGRLYRDVEVFARSHGAAVLAADVLERDADGVAFARRRGFDVYRHARAASLDLTAWPDEAFEADLRRVRDAGIDLSSFAVERAKLGDFEAERRLYDLNKLASTDDPARLDPGFPAFEHWLRLVPRSNGFQPEGQRLAVRGGAFVGLSAVHVDEASGEASTLLTGVHPSVRGRGVAFALKVAALRYARSRGARRVFTEVDARNAPMTRVNDRLGFLAEPGYFGLVRRLP